MDEFLILLEALEFWKCDTELVIDYKLLEFVVYVIEFIVRWVVLELGKCGLEFGVRSEVGVVRVV